EVNAKKQHGLQNLKQVIQQATARPLLPTPTMATLSEKTNTAVQQMVSSLPPDSILSSFNYWQQLNQLLHPAETALTEQDIQHLDNYRLQIAADYEGEIDIAIASARY